ncbi:MAG: hypothetical protein AB1744_08290 [Candidatus Zixiibacteriota bacterium]
MKKRVFRIIFLFAATLTAAAASAFWQETGIDPEVLIDQILAVEAQQRDQIRDMTLDAEYIEGKREKDGAMKEEKRFLKTVYLQFLLDTTLFREEYLEYYKEGELQSEEELTGQAKEQTEKRRKRKTRHIGYPMLEPFTPDHGNDYTMDYLGVAQERIDGYVCHHFRVTALERDSEHLNGDYYFEAETFHLVRVDFEPAKLSKNIMFRLSQLDMSIQYSPTPDGYWLPHRFELLGKGRAALFFGINFAAVERYSNPRINTGIQADIFEEKHD